MNNISIVGSEDVANSIGKLLILVVMFILILEMKSFQVMLFLLCIEAILEWNLKKL